MNTGYIVLGGGCFWCLEAVFQRLNGVTSVESGYAGGERGIIPTYQLVSTGSGGFAEVIKVEYNPSIIRLHTLLDLFFVFHDPTTLNRQGNDVGVQYRSIVFYSNDKEKGEIEEAIIRAKNNWDNPIITQVEELNQFYKAEEYHQNYYSMNSSQPYCSFVITPKISKLRKLYASLLRE